MKLNFIRKKKIFAKKELLIYLLLLFVILGGFFFWKKSYFLGTLQLKQESKNQEISEEEKKVVENVSEKVTENAETKETLEKNETRVAEEKKDETAVPATPLSNPTTQTPKTNNSVSTSTSANGSQPVQPVAPTTTTTPSTPQSYSESGAEDYLENAILALVNAERSRVGVGSLTSIPSLRQAAGIRAVEESDLSFSTQDHNRPNSSSFVTVYSEVGYSGYTSWGENLVYGYQSTFSFTPTNLDALANKMFTSWKNSPGHYANMIKSTFNQTGMGVNLVISGGRLYYFGVQDFAKK